MGFRGLGAAVGLAVLVCAAAAGAGGEHAQRLAADISVMESDAHALLDPAITEVHKRGLRARLGGGLSVLGLLIRLAVQENPRLGSAPPDAVRSFQAALERGDGLGLAKGFSALARLYPFDTRGILPATATPARLDRGRQIHQDICAGCHDAPDLETPRPAFNLFERARALPAGEFAARLVAGVRGDNLMSLQNPLSDEEIASLIALYRQGAPTD
ncbi:MAG: cytochrome c [Rhodospirillales bacterium]|jgi:mono/diheme cytochrome c family protein|nr:cytochrome c [Rhodospirillales bacterium]HJO73422.1 cytochrome c [Rhodospirillales bacterium]